jgi:hypothetical protein
MGEEREGEQATEHLGSTHCEKLSHLFSRIFEGGSALRVKTP